MVRYRLKFKGHVLFVLPVVVLVAFYPTGSLAHVFDESLLQCFTNMINCAENSTSSNCISTLNISSAAAFSVLRSSDGSIIPPVLSSIETATALSYAGCVQYCGTGSQFYWDTFSQDYAAWLLPYLAMLSQLPFGARRRMDNLMSVALTVGSPVLAGYSLYLTLLNARWVNNNLFADIHYPSTAVRQSVARVLSRLQQVPLRVHPGEPGAHFESLVVHPDNDDWWRTFAEELECSQTWSIASAISILWVIIAYLLTATNSIASLAQGKSNGNGMSSSWLWLLPVVVGWLILSPKCDYKRVLNAYNKTNAKVFGVDSNPGLTINAIPDWEQRTNIISPDESRTPPIFNYARPWLWAQNVYVTSLFYRAAHKKSNLRHGDARNGVPRESRIGTPVQIIECCRPDDHEFSGPSILWPRGMFYNMIVASLMALQLQWGTTGAAFLAIWFTPTTGLGCRSLAYLLCGVLSMVVWILLVLSGVLGYYAHHLLNSPPALDVENTRQQLLSTPSPHSESTTTTRVGLPVAIPLLEIRDPRAATVDADSDPPKVAPPNKPADEARLQARTLARLADWLRWIGKTIAIINAIGTIANSLFDYAGVYNNCFCNSSVFTWGSRAFAVIAPSQSDIHLEGNVLIGALMLALASCAVFVGSIYLIRDSLPL